LAIVADDLHFADTESERIECLNVRGIIAIAGTATAGFSCDGAAANAREPDGDIEVW
jgi:hypothetical protein